MIFKKEPYYDSKNDINVLLGKIMDEELRPTISNNFKTENERIFILLQQCWNSKVNIRPSMKEIIEQLKQIIKPKDPSNWNVEEVANWIDKLPLSQNYFSLIKSNFISGVALKTMITREDWKELGIAIFGDQQILINSVKTLFKL